MKKLCPGSVQLASCYSHIIQNQRTEDTQTNLNLKECKPECAP